MRKLTNRLLLLLAALLVMLGTLPAAAQASLNKLSLWNSGETQLRGANIYQRIVYPELDGDDFLGTGHVGPPYTQADFDGLAALGANYVNLSVPGIYTIKPPYVLDTAAQTNLDNLVAMAHNADLFVVISFRTGPGRSDFTFYRDGDWYPPSYLIETVWTQQAAQDAWVNMWRATANRYKDNPVIVGYDLMVEPNSNALLNEYDPEAFFDNYTDSTYDWNRFYPTLVSAIRESDTDTPIILAGNSWGSVYWLNYTRISTDPRVVYIVHNYEPFSYTNQDYDAGGMLSYPGNIDGEFVNQAWQDDLYANTLDVFHTAHPTLPLAVTEIGVTRWSPGAHTYLNDEFSVLESRGLNHAVWMYHANWPPFKNGDNAFDFQLGPNPNNHTNLTSSSLLNVIKANWAQNTLRPSQFLFSPVNAAPARNYLTAAPVTLTWLPVSWASRYWLQVASSTAFSNLLVDDTTISANDDTYQTTLDDGTYYWRIRALRPDGITWGAWSTADTFTLKTAG